MDSDPEKLPPAVHFFMERDPSNLPQKTVAEVVAEFIASREGRGASARYVGDLRARLARFAEAFAVRMASVTAADVRTWLDRLKLSPQTVRNFRTVIGTLFAFAERRGYAVKGTNLAAETEQPKVNGGAVEIYTPSAN